MPQYKYLHRPGIDLLGEQTKEYLTVKQCISVASSVRAKAYDHGDLWMYWLGIWV